MGFKNNRNGLPLINNNDIITFVRDVLNISEEMAIGLTHLAVRGSEREFFRAKWGSDNTCIIIKYNPNRIENTYYVEIGGFLKDIQVSVPEIIGHDHDLCLIVMEDLGDTDLWSLKGESWDVRRPIYNKTLEIIRRLHAFPIAKPSNIHVRHMDGFDLSLYRWEQDYFFENFVKGVCRILPDKSLKERLDLELSTLIERLSATPQCLLHRDLQSQNIMIKHNEPYLIDFQGMRIGSLFYDLGSLLNDPYACLVEKERKELLSYYYRLANIDMDWDLFQLCFWEASVERLMQALGAYGFLGYKKGFKTFIKYIQPGIKILINAISNIRYMPHLLELAMRCRDALTDESLYLDSYDGSTTKTKEALC